MKIDLTYALGKPFRMGGRGPSAYDCIGVCREVVVQVHGERAADTLPCGELTYVAEEEFPGEWHRIECGVSESKPGDAILVKRPGDRGTEHHVYTAVGGNKYATSDRKHGVVLLPTRGVVGDVVGVYRWMPTP